jgi:uncharacterized protein GlcG (DUF336 family)
MFKFRHLAILSVLSMGVCNQVHAAGMCNALPSHDVLEKALTDARHQDNGGLNNDMWGAIVDRTGTVCAVAFTGDKPDAQWPGSRGIAIEKANTANGFSLKNMALSTANIYAGAQPGGFLYGIATSDPVDAEALHAGNPVKLGTNDDPAVGRKIGGIITFGGGLALYDSKGNLLGAVGVSGDTSCADHNIAWRTRNELKLDYVPAGVSPQKNDQIIYDINLTGKSASRFGHPTCGNKEDDIVKKLPGTESVQH